MINGGRDLGGEPTCFSHPSKTIASYSFLSGASRFHDEIAKIRMCRSKNEDGKSRCPNVISMQLAGGFLNSLLHKQVSLVKCLSCSVKFHSIRDWTSSVACQMWRRQKCSWRIGNKCQIYRTKRCSILFCGNAKYELRRENCHLRVAGRAGDTINARSISTRSPNLFSFPSGTATQRKSRVTPSHV